MRVGVVSRPIALVAAAAIVSACGTSSSPSPPPHCATSAQSPAGPHELTALSDDGEQIGGDVVRVIDAPLRDSVRVLDQPDALWILMPRVVAMDLIAGTDDDRLVDMRHEIGPFRGGYAMRFVRIRHPDGALTVWFWVDEDRPRDLRFAWGVLRLVAHDGNKTLLAYQVRITLREGLAKWVLAGRIRRAAMSVPDRARALIEDRVRYLPPLADPGSAE